MTRDDKIILAGYRHAQTSGFPGDCPHASEIDRLYWMEGFIAFHSRAEIEAQAPQRLAQLRARAIAALLAISAVGFNDLDLEIENA